MLQVGDYASLYDAYTRLWTHGWTIVAIDGGLATITLNTATIVVPLSILKPTPSTLHA